jgi:hypothetical protein
MSEVFFNGHWKFNKQMDPDEYIGFIYVIVDTYMKDFYIGRKNYWGQLKKGKTESNWKSYVSSSKYVQFMLSNRPKKEFDFIVLGEYATKSGMSWAEVWSIVEAECPLNTSCKNTLIPKISYKVIEGVTTYHKDLLREIIKENRGDG